MTLPPITRAHINRVVSYSMITLLMLAFTGATIFSLVWQYSNYAATIGFSVYAVFAVVIMLLTLVRLLRYETTIDHIADEIADLCNKMDEVLNAVNKL